MEEIRVLIVDDNDELRMTLAQFMGTQPGIKVVGQAADGVEAMNTFRQSGADVILLDMVMPRLDGFGVLNRLLKLPEAQRPKVIVMTALSRDDFISRAVGLGASYYMIKPIDMTALIERIRDVHRQGYKAPVGEPLSIVGVTLTDKLSNLFLTLGIPAHIKGYQFLREAVCLVVQHPEMIGGITKELYPTVARCFGSSSSKVERAIRHAIEVAWNRGRIETLNAAFGCSVVFQNAKPTNGEFIALIADKMRLDKNAS